MTPTRNASTIMKLFSSRPKWPPLHPRINTLVHGAWLREKGLCTKRQDDLERIPAESRQPAGPGDPGQAPGRFLLRPGRRASTGIRPPAQQGLISGFYAQSEGAADLDLRTGPATVWAGLARGVATR